MKQKRLSKSIAASVMLSALFATSTSVWAESVKREGVYVVPSIGVVSADDALDLEESPSASFGVGYQFANPLSLEVSYLRSDLDSNNSSLNADYSEYRIDALYDLVNNNKLTPYVVFGGGESNLELGSIENTQAFTNLGVGLKYELSQNLALRSDIRRLRHTETKTDDAHFNLGVSFLFGKSNKTSSDISKVASTSRLDTDQDGVADMNDKCPGTALGTTVDSVGCAVNNDVDGDGVPNAQDACPDSKAGAKVTATGCYEELKEDVSISLNITFENNSDNVLVGSKNQISDLAAFMRSYPETNVVINGYTDSVGSETYNKQLSQRRADKVAEILSTEYDIDPSRIESVGHGEANPIATNETHAGRARNRRVDATVQATKVITQ